jgi:hypothetical protein
MNKAGMLAIVGVLPGCLGDLTYHANSLLLIWLPAWLAGTWNWLSGDALAFFSHKPQVHEKYGRG